MSRYARQIRLRFWGKTIQQRIETSVASISSSKNVELVSSLYVAGTGIRKLTISNEQSISVLKAFRSDLFLDLNLDNVSTFTHELEMFFTNEEAKELFLGSIQALKVIENLIEKNPLEKNDLG